MHKSWRTYGLGLVLASFVVAVLVLTAAPVLAKSNELVRLDLAAPVDVRADKLVYDDKAQAYLCEGEVEITQGENRLVADRVRLFAETMIAEAEGDVHLVTKDQVVTAESLAVNLNDNTGKLYNAKVFLRPTNYYLRGEEIEKTGKDTYRVAYGGFTTCDGEHPNWEITGHEVDIELEGYGTAKNTAFRVKDLPVLWSPYLVFPVKFKRQSGLLPPAFGNSKQSGFMFSLPYYQVLGEEHDATITLNYMTKRGLDVGVEYRWALDTESKGMFMADYLNHDSQGENLYLDGYNAEVYDKRWWVRGMADQELFGGTMQLRADIDLVSDQDYMREFTFGYTGYDATNYRLSEMFGRTLEPNTTTTRVNKVNVLRSWSSSTLNMTAYYYDDLTTDNKDTLQSLPTISYDATRQAITENSLAYFQMNSDYTYYYREEGSTGHIINFDPKFSLPLNFNDYLETEPSFKWQQRLYYASLDDNEPQDKDKFGSSYTWVAQLQNSTYLYRVFDFGTEENPLKMKHAFRPFVDYYYRPSMTDSDAPDLAQYQTTTLNYLYYGFKNTFTSKVMVENEETGEVEPEYRDFLKLNFFQRYYIDEARRDPLAGEDDNKPFGDVGARVEFDPWDGMYFESDVYWDPYANRWETINAQLVFSDDRGDEISVDYLFTHDSLKQLYTRAKLALNDEWSLGVQNRHDFDEEQDYETIYQIEYTGQCWGVRLYYRDDMRERGFFVAFSLGGFGELFGTNFGFGNQ